MVTTFAFNAAEGLRYATGAYVFFNFLLTAGLGLGIKLFLGEPVQGNLQDGRATMLVYLAGECAILAAVVLSRRLFRRKPLLDGMLAPENADRIAMGCVVAAIGLPALVSLLGLTSLLSTVAQLNRFSTLAILISVYQRVKATGGRSSFTWPALIAALYSEWLGVTSASKEALFTAVAAWLIAAAAAGYRINFKRLLFVSSSLYLMTYILVPYSQYGRAFRANGYGDVPIEKAEELLSHPLETRKKVAQEGEDALTAGFHWFNHSQGFLDRLNMVSVDDPLIYVTNQGQVAGLYNIWLYFPNAIPTFLYKNKPFLYFGNTYGKEIRIIQQDDFVTSIAFSPFGEAYHTGKWLGIWLVMPIILCALFTVADSVAGQLGDSPWPLFYALSYAHLASEGALGSPVYLMTEGAFILIAIALVSVYVAPLLGTLFVGPRRLSPSRAAL